MDIILKMIFSTKTTDNMDGTGATEVVVTQNSRSTIM